MKIVLSVIGLVLTVVVIWFLRPYIHENPAALLGAPGVSAPELVGVAVLFVLVYTAGAVILFPSAVLTLTGGYLFGASFGLLINLIGATAGGVACFHLARRLRSLDFVQALRQKVYEHTRFLPYGLPGPIKVVLLRLTPGMPYSGINYGMGLTPVSGWHFALGTFFGLIPKVLLGTVVGAASRSLPLLQ